jgi:hypothetical protein
LYLESKEREDFIVWYSLKSAENVKKEGKCMVSWENPLEVAGLVL